VKIGLEAHIYPGVPSKLFCACAVPMMCPVCTAQPGSKPMAVNRKAVEDTIKVALALKCRVMERITFMRKQYFYPDLPANFQRTSTPFGADGGLKDIGIKEVHLEEDAGRLDLKTGKVDFGRAGTPLIEIVTEPCMKSPSEATEFLKNLSDLMRYIGVSYPLRFKVDTNISLAEARVEVKNIGSIKGVKTAFEYEAQRQGKVISSGGKVLGETRHYDEDTGRTFSAREKETEDDYRKIPDADLPDYDISVALRSISRKISEDLFERRARYMKTYTLSREACIAVTPTPGFAELFERLAAKFPPAFVGEWIRSDLIGELSYRGIFPEDAKPDEGRLESLLGKYASGGISKLRARIMLRELLDKGSWKERPADVDVSKAVREVMERHKDAVQKLKRGKKVIADFLVGEVSQALGFQIHPQKIREEMEKVLEKTVQIKI